MKITELMVGDWVEFETMTSNYLYGKVEGIKNNYIAIETINAIEDVPIEKVGKIVVTPDILDKNLIKCIDYWTCSEPIFIKKELNADIYVIFSSIDNMWHGSNEVAIFASVHELQNILRVMGYNDLANWFRI